MKKSVWCVMSLVACVAACAAAVVAITSGGCTSHLETVSGMSVPMKCHWTYIAVALIEGLSAFALLGLVFVKERPGRRWLASVGFIAQILTLAALHTSLMGLCGNPDMHCHTTALYCTILAVITLVVCVILFALADPKRATLPKREL